MSIKLLHPIPLISRTHVSLQCRVAIPFTKHNKASSASCRWVRVISGWWWRRPRCMSISMWGQVRRGRFFVYVSAVFVLSFEAHLRRVRTYNSVVWMFEAKIPSYVYIQYAANTLAPRDPTRNTHTKQTLVAFYCTSNARVFAATSGAH